MSYLLGHAAATTTAAGAAGATTATTVRQVVHVLGLALGVVADHNLQGVASLVHADKSVLQGLKAGGRGHVTRIVAAIDVQQRVVTLLDVLHQLQHLLRVL